MRIQRGLATYSSLDLLSPWPSRQTISHCLEFIIDMLFLGLSPSRQNEQADTLLGFLPPRRTTPTVTWWHDNDTAIHLWYQQITQNHLWIKPDIFVLSHYMWLYKSLPRVMVSISLLCQKRSFLFCSTSTWTHREGVCGEHSSQPTKSIIFAKVITVADALHYFLWIWVSILYHFSSTWKFSFSISGSTFL